MIKINSDIKFGIILTILLFSTLLISSIIDKILPMDDEGYRLAGYLLAGLFISSIIVFPPFIAYYLFWKPIAVWNHNRELKEKERLHEK